jgi:hypothetical protein
LFGRPYRQEAKFFQEEYSKISSMMGRIYASDLAGKFLSKMTGQGNAESIRRAATDVFDALVVTKKKWSD